MRLLNAFSLEFETFYGDIPPYAILSHTWGEEFEEPTCQDIKEGRKTDTPGYSKIKACCDQAVKSKLKYIWADTCCIDKSNSAELQEAINSMFKWYKQSEVCYAYLSDYTISAREQLKDDAFMGKKWFTRGWTLQELIAPRELLFYNRDWDIIGSKTDLGGPISSITRISEEVLRGQKNLEDISAAQKMSWASMRKTTRDEDIAYCLLGVFGVHMPLIYGEGSMKAFIRLQEVIMKQSDDHSLFAWRQEQGMVGHGLLAYSPDLFAESSTLVQTDYFEPRAAYMMTNRGLEIRLSLQCTLDGETHFATLGCGEPQNGDTKNIHQIGIYVTPLNDNRFARIRLDQLVRIDPRALCSDYKAPTLEMIYIPQKAFKEPPIGKPQYFRVIEPKLPDFWRFGRFWSWLRVLEKPIFRSPYWISQSKASSVGFTHAHSTIPGQRESLLDFRLERGGRVGVLFRPSKKFISYYSNPSNTLEFMAVIFGVNLDKSVYGDIIGIMNEDLHEIIKRQERSRGPIVGGTDNRLRRLYEVKPIEWFETYVREAKVASWAKKVEKKIWDLRFSVELVLDQRENVHSVEMTVAPTGEF